MNLRRLQPFKSAPQPDEKLMKHLARQPLFKDTPQDVLAIIATQVKIREVAKDDFLIRAGDPSEAMLIIRTGWVKVITSDDKGEEVILNHIGPGQTLGEMSLLDRKPRSNSVIALRPVEALEIEYDVILNLLDQYPALARSLLQEMSNRVRFANAYIEESVEWCRHIAAGNYDFVQGQVEQTQSTVVDMTKPDHARASAFLSVFFRMVEDVKKREASLKQQVQLLTIQIDEAKREKSVKELTDTDFFEELQEAARRVRAEREAKLNQSSESDESSN